MDIGHLLEEHGIKPTPNRLIITRTLSSGKRPMSMTELETEIGSIDKSGIFRTLMLLKDHHLVHVLEDGGEGVRYELCHSEDNDHDDDLHAHFFCEKCHKTYCLEYIHVPDADLPEGYEVRTVNYMFKGICPSCSGYSRR